ncbi:MAG TPA: hypothetical protein VE242_14210 [Chthoniobacterales bacterium]|nr:hypothetical protein [Chthoniobacterales bacterium]
MIRFAQVLRLVVIGLVVAPSPAECAAFLKLPVNGYLAGKPISTTVDSALAQYYLENFLSRKNAIPLGQERPLDKRVAEIEERFGERPLDWLSLRELSRQTSPDFATLFFIKQSLSKQLNAQRQSAYWQELARIRSSPGQNHRGDLVRAALRQYKFLFIPGFHYLSDPSSGADFYNQRQFFGHLGLRVELAGIQEDGTIEENAGIIADIVRAESKSNSSLILVSTSKGGPETALALGKLLDPNETASVKAWLSVGGLIQGTFLADHVMGWPKSWLAQIALSYAGVDARSLPGMTTIASRARMKQIGLPRHIFALQFVGAPLSGDIADDVRHRYLALRKYGPNDGLTLLADELLPNGITIIEPGLDHFYRDPEIDLKSLAIANVVADELTRQAVSSK